MQDRFSRWVEAVPVVACSAEALAKVFFYTWVVRYGAPQVIIADKGRQFISNLFNEFTETLGVELKNSTSYHPHTNGVIERMQGTLKNAIRCLIEYYKD